MGLLRRLPLLLLPLLLLLLASGGGGAAAAAAGGGAAGGAAAAADVAAPVRATQQPPTRRARGALCDSALDQVCGGVRGAGAACTSCQSSFSHQVVLRGAGCTAEDLAGYCAAGINPRHVATTTVYHVYPSEPSRSGSALVIADKNTADLRGMIFFDLRSLGNPIECAEPYLPGSSSPDPTVAFDCTNRETHASAAQPLHITQLELTVDARYGDYAFCNICYDGYDPYGHGPSSRYPRKCDAGQYVCDCVHRNPLTAAKCNGTVGQLDIASFFGVVQPIGPSASIDWKWWEYNAALKIGGYWWCEHASSSGITTSS